jgi:hypothetical protein
VPVPRRPLLRRRAQANQRHPPALFAGDVAHRLAHPRWPGFRAWTDEVAMFGGAGELGRCPTGTVGGHLA